MSNNSLTVAFFGASTGVGHSALKHTLAAGHHCIALCRTPSKLTTIFPPTTTPNLKIITGNAHDPAAVSQCLLRSNGNLVDLVISTIGGKPIFSKLTIDDPEVCRKGAATLLQCIAELRRRGAAGSPHLVIFSTTGISRFGRDVPLPLVPLYHVALKVPHEDKVIMEDSVVGSGEAFTIVRASLLTDGESKRGIRVGIEDPKTGLESKAVGYTISREDSGRWIAENVILGKAGKYDNKIVTITY